MARAATPTVQRVMVATDRSETADHAVRWAATLAATYQAELILFHALPVETADVDRPSGVMATQGAAAGPTASKAPAPGSTAAASSGATARSSASGATAPDGDIETEDA